MKSSDKLMRGRRVEACRRESTTSITYIFSSFVSSVSVTKPIQNMSQTSITYKLLPEVCV